MTTDPSHGPVTNQQRTVIFERLHVENVSTHSDMIAIITTALKAAILSGLNFDLNTKGKDHEIILAS